MCADNGELRASHGPHLERTSLRESGRGCGLLGPSVICFEVGFMVRLRGGTHGSEEDGQ